MKVNKNIHGMNGRMNVKDAKKDLKYMKGDLEC